MKNILAIDTASNVLSVALKKDNSIYQSARLIGFKHSETLIPLIRQLFLDAGINANQLDLIICTQGPGSFTGLRIGLATVKGLSMGSGSPFVAIPTLDLYSYGFTFFDGVVVPIIDAKRKCFYAAIYKNGERLTDQLDITPENLLELLKPYDRILFTGPDSNLIQKYIAQKNNFSFDPCIWRPKVIDLLELGIEHYKKGASSDNIGPEYIRMSDAEITLSGNR